MCGIAGIIIPTGEACDWESQSPNESLSRMLKRVQHRGPDDQGRAEIWGSASRAFLGHTRLSILDLTAAGHQPMYDPETGNYVTFNGEIYNFRELRSELGRGSRAWRTQTDTEVILRAYERWGVEALRRMRGMFAFALWDNNSQCLLLSRDSLGVKPLYYFHDRSKFIFASEIRSLLASGVVPKELCKDGLSSYLSHGAVGAPLTIIKGVRMLPPGHHLRVSSRDGNIKAEEGEYDADFYLRGQGDVPATRRDAVVRLREVLEDTVRHHLVSDVPVGTFLSGGIDSSAVVALMSRVSGERPRTFSVVFAEKEFTEAEYARQISQEFGTEHHEVGLAESDLLSMLPRALRDMDHPTMDGINTYVVAKAVHDAGLKVALSGLGGDELFAGYPSFRRALLMKKLALLPGGVRRATAGVGRMVLNHSVRQRKAWDLLDCDPSPYVAYSVSREVFSAGEVAEMTGRRRQHGKRAYPSASPYGPDAEDFINLVSLYELRGYMADVLLRDADQMSMAHSLEVRVPFVDSSVVPYVLSLPGQWKVEARRPKPLLLDALGDLLPEQIWRRRKMGFTLPFERWMRSSLSRDVAETINSGSSSNLISGRRFARRLWDDFKNLPGRERWSRPWALYVLNKWCEMNEVSA